MVKDVTIKALAAIASITVIECYALSLGVNGVALAATIGGLAGLGGYFLAKRQSVD